MSKQSKAVQSEINIQELKGLITHIVSTNQVLQQNGKLPLALDVEGESGIGKTSSIKEFCAELELDFIKVNLAQLDELGDIIGFPTRQFEMALNKAKESEKENWILRWADESLLEDYRLKGYTPTGKDRMAYSLPEWVPSHDKGTIILFDDWTRAQSRFIQAVMEIIDRQEFISWTLPKNCHIILSSNPDNGDYNVQSQDSAQKTRYISAKLKFDADVWAKWAEKSGIDGRCINFLLLHPELVTQDTNARAITNFFNAISSFDSFEKNLPMIQLIGEGSVGVEFSSMFSMFINNKLDKLVDPKTMLIGADEDKVFALLKDAIGMGTGYRGDIAAVLCTRFTNYTLVYAEDNPIDDKIIKRIKAIATKQAFGNDLQYYAIREILNGNKKKFERLMMDPEVVRMATK